MAYKASAFDYHVGEIDRIDAIFEKKLAVISKELHTSYMVFQLEGSTEFFGSILQTINSMLLDMLAAIGRKDYEYTKHLQQKGFLKQGYYADHKIYYEKRKIIASLLEAG